MLAHGYPKGQGKDRKQRWLFVTGLPVLAGTLCVMAMMFNICALSSGWQQPAIVDGRTISPPIWTEALQIISLIIAATVYIIYLLLMRRHDKHVNVFRIIVLGWLVAAAVLFIVVGVTVQRHQHDPPTLRGNYTEAFYYGVFAAGLYSLVALLLALYIVGAPRIHLSRSNRSRVQQTNISLRSLWLAIVLLIGAAIYRAVEGWSLLDALYFADFTILTIGIGNLVPKTHIGRSLLFPYATTGIIAIGLVVSAVLSFTHEMRDMKLRLHLAQVQNHRKQKASYECQELPGTPAAQVRDLHKVKTDFHRSMNRRELLLFLLAWLVLWFISAAVFRASETQQGWSYFVALNFTYTSLTTIGYGDFYPISNLGKAFFVFWSLLALPILTNLIIAMGEFLHEALVFWSATLWRQGVAFIHLVPRHCVLSNSKANEITSQQDTWGVYSTSSLPGCVIGNMDWSTPSTFQSNQDDGVLQSVLRLLIVEEMDRLITVLRDTSHCEYLDLTSTWARIVPLLYSNEQNIGPLEPFWVATPSPSPHQHEQMMRYLNIYHESQDEGTEIILMLTCLVDKLRANLRSYES